MSGRFTKEELERLTRREVAILDWNYRRKLLFGRRHYRRIKLPGFFTNGLRLPDK